jgi:ABC-type nitrate/sulfonate/bicarbonate transport system permease component
MLSFLDAYLAPKKDIPRRAYLTVSTLMAAAILALWCALSYGEVVRSDFLPTPDEVVAPAINGVADGSRWSTPASASPTSCPASSSPRSSPCRSAS